MRVRLTWLIVPIAALAFVACERENRTFRQSPPSANVVNTIQVSELHPGGQQIASPHVPNIYEENAYAVSEGKRLYENFNCVGCHSHGGGGIGPPLMDNEWIYGGEPANIFASIMEGRPNGMPSWRGRIPEDQGWQLVAYIRSMSGQVRSDVAPSRSDHMQNKTPEANTKREKPTGITGAPEH
ncbi:MAG: cytochrome c [Acidobacteria bacterium]|nr:cytochrome c [Acidobacteriota bacterium]